MSSNKKDAIENRVVSNKNGKASMKRMRFLLVLLGLHGIFAQELPVNNDCSTALPLRVDVDNGDVTGSTRAATNDQLRLCGMSLLESPGVWYRYERSAPEPAQLVVRVSTCHPETNFDTALSLFQTQNMGDQCSSLQCTNSRDDDSECRFTGENSTVTTKHSTIAWIIDANEKATYFIQVHGSEANHSGEFTLTIEEEASLDVGDEATSSSFKARGNFLIYMITYYTGTLVLGFVPRYFTRNK